MKEAGAGRRNRAYTFSLKTDVCLNVRNRSWLRDSALTQPATVHDPVRRCGNRLKLERDLIEADLAGDRAQGSFRLAVGIRRVVDEVHRPAMHYVAQLTAYSMPCSPLYYTY